MTDDPVCARIRGEMASKRVKGAVLAAELGISPSTLSQKIHGHRRLFTAELQAIAHVLGVTVGSLMGEEPVEDGPEAASAQVSDGAATASAMPASFVETAPPGYTPRRDGRLVPSSYGVLTHRHEQALEALRQVPRPAFKDVAAVVGVSASTITRWVRQFEDAGLLGASEDFESGSAPVSKSVGPVRVTGDLAASSGVSA